MGCEGLNEEDCCVGKVWIRETRRASVGQTNRVYELFWLVPFYRLKKAYLIKEFFVIILWLIVICEEERENMTITIPCDHERSRWLMGVSMGFVLMPVHFMGQNKLQATFFVYEGRIMTALTHNSMIQ